MVSWLENSDNKLSDVKLWGVSKLTYTFSDLLEWLANGGEDLTMTKTETQSDMKKKKKAKTKGKAKKKKKRKGERKEKKK